MENQIIETRYAVELRASETGTIQGTAIVFNSESELLGGQFREVIKPSAATEEFLKTQDIVMKYQHGDDSVLARYRPGGQRNSLHFSVDNRGVHFDFKPKTRDLGLLEDIKNGDLSACSFAFRVGQDDNSERWEKRADGSYLRTISKFDVLADFSIVIQPAYQATSVSTRGLEEIKQKEEAQVLEKANEVKALQDKKIADEQKLAEYYKKYDDIITALKK
jgi:HK97 family phage prohead protease